MAYQKAVAGGAVHVYEFAGNPLSRVRTARRAERAPTGAGETRHFRLAWSDVEALFAECFPAAPALPGIHPTKSYLYVESIEVKAFPDMPSETAITYGDVIDYTEAMASVVYSTLPYDPSELMRWHQSGSNEVVLLPSNSWYWEGSPPEVIKNEDVPAAKFVPIIDHSVELYRVNPAYEATILARCRTLCGKVNRTTWRGGAAETVLFEGYDSDSIIDSSGQKTLTFSYRFREKNLKFGNTTLSFGWNHFPRQDATGAAKWQRIIDSSANFVYPRTTVAESNFDYLFTY